MRSQRGGAEKGYVTPFVSAVLAVLLASVAAQAGTPPHSGVHVESNRKGEIAIDARGVTVEEALQAIASKAGFEVMLDPSVKQPPLNMKVSMTPVEDILHQILRGQNYALVYDGDGAFLSRVIVLPPSTAGPPNLALMQRARMNTWQRRAGNR